MCASYKTVAILLIESTRVGHHYTYICKEKMTSVPNRNIIDLNIFNLIIFYSNGIHTLWEKHGTRKQIRTKNTSKTATPKHNAKNVAKNHNPVMHNILHKYQETFFPPI